MKIMGLTMRQYMTLFDRINLLQVFPGKHKRDDKFPMRLARVAASAVEPLVRDRTVILVGRNVSQAWPQDLDGLDFYTQIRQENGPGTLTIIPHPSGRNHWYNSPDNRRQAEDFWKEFLHTWDLLPDAAAGNER